MGRPPGGERLRARPPRRPPEDPDRPRGGREPPAGPSLVAFDLWDTIVALSPRAARAYETRRRHVWIACVEGWPRKWETQGHPLSTEDAVEEVFARARRSAREGVSLSLASQGELVGELTGRIPRCEDLERELGPLVRSLPIRVVPGARRLLERLQALGCRVGFVSNLTGESAAIMRWVLADKGLLRFADATALSEELPWCMPSPRIFQYCLEQAGVPPARAVYVGALSEGQEGAIAAGLSRIILVGGRGRHGRGPWEAPPARGRACVPLTCVDRLEDLSPEMVAAHLLAADAPHPRGGRSRHRPGNPTYRPRK